MLVNLVNDNFVFEFEWEPRGLAATVWKKGEEDWEDKLDERCNITLREIISFADEYGFGDEVKHVPLDSDECATNLSFLVENDKYVMEFGVSQMGVSYTYVFFNADGWDTPMYFAENVTLEEIFGVAQRYGLHEKVLDAAPL